MTDRKKWKQSIRQLCNEVPPLKQFYRERLKLIKQYPPSSKPEVLEQPCDLDTIFDLNQQGYGVFFFVNPSSKTDGFSNGKDITCIRYLCVDMDLKDGEFRSMEAFIHELAGFELLPTIAVDSGNGIHAYWAVEGLPVYRFKEFQQRLCRKLRTDKAVCSPVQIMRLPGTFNVKEGWTNRKEVKKIAYDSDHIYSMEEFDKVLPPLPKSQGRGRPRKATTYDGQPLGSKIPALDQLCNVKDRIRHLLHGKHQDRSKADFELACHLFRWGFTPWEVASVIGIGAKAMTKTAARRNQYVELTVNNAMREVGTEAMADFFDQLPPPKRGGKQ